jgi:uncharacterized BrkB/YihY/UPF0761 family membrane protein
VADGQKTRLRAYIGQRNQPAQGAYSLLDIGPTPQQARQRHPRFRRRFSWRHARSVTVAAFQASITDRMSLAAAGCGFYATMALFPAISMLISVYGLIFNPLTVTTQLDLLAPLLPAPAYALIAARVQQLVSQPSGNLSIGLLVSFIVTF